jgi:hypothetical protein
MVTPGHHIASYVAGISGRTGPVHNEEPVMNITSSGLTRAAGIAAVVAGSIFIAIQVNHPSSDAFVTETDQWVARSCAKMVMAALALVGITGMYLRQFRQAGILGLIGYFVFAAGYLAMFSVQVIAAAVLPALTETEPGFVNDVVAAAVGRTPDGDIGGMQTVLNLSGVGYMVGGLLFGIALFRTRILARWAAALLAVSTIGTAALAVLPESFDRPFAIPEAVALIGLGVSLWRNHRDSAAGTTDSTSPVREAAVR